MCAKCYILMYQIITTTRCGIWPCVVPFYRWVGKRGDAEVNHCLRLQSWLMVEPRISLGSRVTALNNDLHWLPFCIICNLEQNLNTEFEGRLWSLSHQWVEHSEGGWRYITGNPCIDSTLWALCSKTWFLFPCNLKFSSPDNMGRK